MMRGGPASKRIPSLSKNSLGMDALIDMLRDKRAMAPLGPAATKETNEEQESKCQFSHWFSHWPGFLVCRKKVLPTNSHWTKLYFKIQHIIIMAKP